MVLACLLLSVAALAVALTVLLWAADAHRRLDELEADRDRDADDMGVLTTVKAVDHPATCKCGSPLLADGSCAWWWGAKGKPPKGDL